MRNAVRSGSTAGGTRPNALITARLEAAAQYGVVGVPHPAGEGSVSWLTYSTPGTVIDTIWAPAAGVAASMRVETVVSAQNARHSARRTLPTRHAPYVVS